MTADVFLVVVVVAVAALAVFSAWAAWAAPDVTDIVGSYAAGFGRGYADARQRRGRYSPQAMAWMAQARAANPNISQAEMSALVAAIESSDWSVSPD